jgi:hypothetical protein
MLSIHNPLELSKTKQKDVNFLNANESRIYLGVNTCILNMNWQQNRGFCVLKK